MVKILHAYGVFLFYYVCSNGKVRVTTWCRQVDTFMAPPQLNPKYATANVDASLMLIQPNVLLKTFLKLTDCAALALLLNSLISLYMIRPVKIRGAIIRKSCQFKCRCTTNQSDKMRRTQ